ncbi:hypothetical protein NQ314_010663 [Rhamnusium bicolor]|uniref:Putative nuclease HARBI1 n=1 Tax=Rhamnusium bicolor TaxID=1586634 RepID=A0AAV8XNR4_9CUCU|nr:hypothetical protein NQ314_010663 [Rhamnusium bicolor]
MIINLVRELIHTLTPHLQQPIIRRGISIEHKVLGALRFYAIGSYQRCVGEELNLGLSQTSIHRVIHEVTTAIVDVMANDIRFPTTAQERHLIKTQFMNRWGFPGAVGVIDCTHVAILKPKADEHNFLNRKGFHSTNTQIICDSDLKIRNIFASYGGATHDSFIWNQSAIKEFMQGVHCNSTRLVSVPSRVEITFGACNRKEGATITSACLNSLATLHFLLEFMVINN